MCRLDQLTSRVVKSEASPTRIPPISLVPALLKNNFLYLLEKGSFHVIGAMSSSSCVLAQDREEKQERQEKNRVKNAREYVRAKKHNHAFVCESLMMSS